MTDPLREALDRSKARREELLELDAAIRSMAHHADPDRFPRPPPPRPQQQHQDRRPAPPSMTAVEVESGWAAGGSEWLRRLSRRDRSAVVAATGDPRIGPQLAADDGFVRALFPLLQRRQQRRAASSLACQRFPPSKVLCQQVYQITTDDPAGAPEWWGWLPHAPQFAVRLSESIGTHGWPAIRESWGLPNVISSSTWADAVVQNLNNQDIDQLERLLAFLDGGEDKVSPAPLRPGHYPVIKMLVGAGWNQFGARLRIAAALRRRVGDVFGLVDSVRWTRLEAERRTLRSWVANEILDVLFKHLVPHGMGRHQTDPRREFWSRYTSKVDRLWLLVDNRLKRRLDRPEIRELLDKVGDVVEIRDLQGGEEQAVVWMHLRSDQNRVITVIEGNANTTLRIRVGEQLPPGRGAVNYSSHIVHGGRDDFAKTHQGNWQADVGRALTSYGIRP